MVGDPVDDDGAERKGDETMARDYGAVKIADARRYARRCSLASHHKRGRTIDQMELVSALCRFAEMAAPSAGGTR
jgi:hypothetical protein